MLSIVEIFYFLIIGIFNFIQSNLRSHPGKKTIWVNKTSTSTQTINDSNLLQTVNALTNALREFDLKFMNIELKIDKINLKMCKIDDKIFALEGNLKKPSINHTLRVLDLN